MEVEERVIVLFPELDCKMLRRQEKKTDHVFFVNDISDSAVCNKSILTSFSFLEVGLSEMAAF